jgi:hypothetical protein
LAVTSTVAPVARIAEGDRPCGAVDAVAREHLSEVDRKISDLRALRRELTIATALETL